MSDACATCAFFHDRLTTIRANAPKAGECRAQPPRFDIDVGEKGWRIWPAVWREDWCVSHTPKNGR